MAGGVPDGSSTGTLRARAERLGTRLGSQLGELDRDARSEVATGFHRWQAAIRHGFEAMRENGTLPVDVDVERLATAMLASLQGGLLLCQMHRSTAAPGGCGHDDRPRRQPRFTVGSAAERTGRVPEDAPERVLMHTTL